jgi:hypothetical protein
MGGCSSVREVPGLHPEAKYLDKAKPDSYNGVFILPGLILD